MPTRSQPPNRKPSTSSSPPPPSPAAADTKRPTDSVPMQAGSFAKLPMRFGRYQVEKLLGKGAMGAVYLARDTQLERPVALKIPKLSASAKGSEKLLKRLKTEAIAAAQIDHPSVCSVFDSGDINGVSYIAMQFIEGETLKDRLKSQPKTPQEAVVLISQLAEGLAEAHSRKIYHRDLKPENIKLNRRGVPVIMDFGLAKLATTFRSDASVTQAGTTLGTPAYMSPEQAGGNVEEIDHRSDIYALGVMLYEMLTGTWPFSGSAIQVMGQKSVLEPPSPISVKPELNPQLAAVCHRMIAKDRQNRYQNAHDVIAALQSLEMGSETQASAGSVVSGHSQALAPALLPPFEQDDALSSIVARKQQAANRGGAMGMVGGKTRQITHSVTCWWREKSRGMKWTGFAAGVLVAGLIGMHASGVFTKVKRADGTLVIEVNEPGADVFVDGEKVNLTWTDGKKKATVQVKAGERQVEVRKDGFSVAGKKITFRQGDREIFKANLETTAVVAEESSAARTNGTAQDATTGNASGFAKTFSCEIPGAGNWSIDGNELVCLAASPGAKLLFGDLNWTDYDLSFEMKVERGWLLRVYFRYQDEANNHSYMVGSFNNTWQIVDTMEGGAWGERQVSRPLPLAQDAWYQMQVTVRGQTGQCFLNGDSGGEFAMPHLLNGRVGFFVEDGALFHFRNIVVKAPDGIVLLEGLPEGLRD